MKVSIRQTRYLAGASLLLALAACSSSPSRSGPPDWVNGISARYANALYLVGRGEASTASEAKDRARADLTKTLEVAVSEQTRDVQTFTRETKEGKTQEASQLDVSRAVQTRTEKVVRGIEIGDFWQDPASKQYYALAVLNRHQAGQSMREAIDQLDGETQALTDKAKNQPDLLKKISLARAALDAQLTREGIQRTLQVVDTTGAGVPSRYNLGQMRADVLEILGRVRMDVRATGGQAEALAPLIKGATGSAGFTVDGAQAQYVLTADLQIDDLAPRDGWLWQKGTLSVTLADSANHTLGTKRWDIKISAQQKEMLSRRALDQVLAILNKELRDTLLGFANAQ